ncbi:MAG: hypothetical protein BGO67_12235 [Alphaproteobacteria bacterium 41-28]|nr:MAG: hypothetical protein BGO67_12235 [Alphaproteobacteria bacterium 41-28]
MRHPLPSKNVSRETFSDGDSLGPEIASAFALAMLVPAKAGNHPSPGSSPGLKIARTPGKTGRRRNLLPI